MRWKYYLFVKMLFLFSTSIMSAPSAPKPSTPGNNDCEVDISKYGSNEVPFDWTGSSAPSGVKILYKVQLSKGGTPNDFDPYSANWLDEQRTALDDGKEYLYFY